MSQRMQYKFDNGNGQFCSYITADSEEEAWMALHEFMVERQQLVISLEGVKEMFILQEVRLAGVDLKQLQEDAERLLALLKDPHPGLFTWNDALGKRMRSLNDLTSQGLAAS